MEKKWDTVIPADLKRLFVIGTCVPLVTKGLTDSCLGIWEVRCSTYACIKVQGEIIIYPCVIIIKLLRSIVIFAEFHC